jgi:hypothetical protein
MRQWKQAHKCNILPQQTVLIQRGDLNVSKVSSSGSVRTFVRSFEAFDLQWCNTVNSSNSECSEHRPHDTGLQYTTTKFSTASGDYAASRSDKGVLMYSNVVFVKTVLLQCSTHLEG